MIYEVERKFRLLDLPAFHDAMAAANVTLSAPIRQEDHYFRHPIRDFAETDEALRLRVTDRHCRVTYKGPKIDSQTKTRREIELPFGEEVSVAEASELLTVLGFSPVAQVIKSRRTATQDADGWQISIDLDDVEQLGHFVELEITTTECEVPDAQAAMENYVQKLGLTKELRESYLELLLDQQGN